MLHNYSSLDMDLNITWKVSLPIPQDDGLFPRWTVNVHYPPPIETDKKKKKRGEKGKMGLLHFKSRENMLHFRKLIGTNKENINGRDYELKLMWGENIKPFVFLSRPTRAGCVPTEFPTVC